MKKHRARTYYKDDIFLKQIGDKMRGIRLAKYLSIKALADACGIDYSQVNRMELGKVNFTVSYLYKIGTVLNINPKELLP